MSNFTVALLDEAVEKCAEPLVANQIEYHAYLRQDKVLAACARPSFAAGLKARSSSARRT